MRRTGWLICGDFVHMKKNKKGPYLFSVLFSVGTITIHGLKPAEIFDFLKKEYNLASEVLSGIADIHNILYRYPEHWKKSA